MRKPTQLELIAARERFRAAANTPQMQAARRIAERCPTEADLQWFASGALAYINSDGCKPLEHFLGLPLPAGPEGNSVTVTVGFSPGKPAKDRDA
jgi:hypothetical protein